MTGDRYVITPAHAFAGTLSVPGDKAIGHRALLVGAGCGGTTSIAGLSTGADVATTLAAIQKLGCKTLNHSGDPLVESLKPSSGTEFSLKLEGSPLWEAWRPSGTVECNNSGTTMRLLMGILAGRPGAIRMTGDRSLSSRPMDRVAEPLRLMGARIGLAEGGTPPVELEGGKLNSIRYSLPVASAQVKSALLLAGLSGRTPVAVEERVPTRDHTERLLRFLGADVSAAPDIRVQPTQLFSDKEINIPGDFSSASFLLTGAALVQDGDVTVDNVGLNPTRTAFLRVLERFGARVETGGVHDVSGEPRGWIRVRAGDRRPPTVEAGEVAACIDELPLVAVLGAAAEGTTEIRGAHELRLKESDRVGTIVDGLTALGVNARALPDGFVIEGGPLRGAMVSSFGDHRIAMALAVAGLVASGETVVTGWGAVAVSYPEFGAHLALLTGS